MKHVVGIDVSKNKLDCLWLRDAATRKVKTKVINNDKRGHKQLAGWLLKTVGCEPQELMVVMEATGIYHENAALALFEAGFHVSVTNPAHIKAFAQSLGNTHKTDKRDSLVIALYGKANQPAPWQPEPPAVRELKALIARLRALEVDLQREQNRFEKARFNEASTTVTESIQLMLAELEKEKLRIENEIDDHIDNHPKLKKDRKLLHSIPGVGDVASRQLLAVIHSRDFTSARQVAAYLGLIPGIVESGVFKGRSALTKIGPAPVRAKLYMAAVSASQCNPDIQRMRQRLHERGKTKMQTIGAAMRKLVHICFGVLKSQTEYVPQAA